MPGIIQYYNKNESSQVRGGLGHHHDDPSLESSSDCAIVIIQATILSHSSSILFPNPAPSHREDSALKDDCK